MHLPSIIRRLRRPGLPALIAVALGVGISFFLFTEARRRESSLIERVFEHHALNRIAALQLTLTNTLAGGQVLASALELQDSPGFDAFHRLAARLLQTTPGLRTIEWVPRVPSYQRPQFEYAARQSQPDHPAAREAFSHYQISERSAQGGPVPAASREEYYPVRYAEPFQGNEAEFGFDIASDPTLHETFARCLATAQPAASPRIRLAPGAGGQYGFLVFFPVFATPSSTNVAARSAGQLSGFFVESFSISNLLDSAFSPLEPIGLDKLLLDQSAPEPQAFLCNHWSRLQPSPGSVPLPIAQWREGLHHEAILTVADRHWAFVLKPSSEFLAARTTWTAGYLLLGGLLLTFLLAGYLSQSARRASQLDRTNQQLVAQIAASKHGELELRESEERYRLLFESNPYPMWLYDVETLAFMQVNEAAIRHYGFSREEFLSMTIKEIRPPEEIPVMLKKIASLTPGLHRSGIWRHRKQDGTLFSVEITTYTLELAGRRAELVLACDITERLRAEDALREASRFNEQIIAGAQEGIIVYDQQLKYKVWNPYMERLTGCSAAQVLGKSPLDVFPFLRHTDLPRTWSRALATGETGHAEFEFQIPEAGKTGWSSHKNAPLRNARGEIIGVIALVCDITERKQAEAALFESQEHYRRLFDNSPDAIFIQSRGRFAVVNPAALRLFGAQRPEQIVGTPVLDRIHPDCRQLVARRAEAVHETRQAQPSAPEVYLRLDGTSVEVEVAAAPFPMNGELAGLVIARDITDRKSLEKQLLRSQRVESIGTLASGIAHDLNNILAPILMSAELLKLKKPADGASELLDNIQASAQRGARIVKQVLTFARGVDGQRVTLQLRHLVRELQKIIEETFPKNLILRFYIPKDLWTVAGDATQLHQVLLNLCVNARDAMPEGGTLLVAAENVQVPNPKIGLFADGHAGPHVLVTVSDTGQGIAPAIIEKIFDPFFTTKEQGKGTGLGLSTVLGIVRSHGGFIDVLSEPGQGSSFKVYIPAKPAETSPPLDAIPASAPQGAGECVLIVDDEAGVRHATERTLSQHGYRVLLAANGKEALSLVDAHAQHLKAVVTDIMMPVMDGLALALALKHSHPRLPVIACTGLGQDNLRARLKMLGVDSFLEKPYASEALLTTLHGRLAASSSETGAIEPDRSRSATANDSWEIKKAAPPGAA